MRKTSDKKYGATFGIKYGNAYRGSRKKNVATIILAVVALFAFLAIIFVPKFGFRLDNGSAYPAVYLGKQTENGQKIATYGFRDMPSPVEIKVNGVHSITIENGPFIKVAGHDDGGITISMLGETVRVNGNVATLRGQEYKLSADSADNASTISTILSNKPVGEGKDENIYAAIVELDKNAGMVRNIKIGLGVICVLCGLGALWNYIKK